MSSILTDWTDSCLRSNRLLLIETTFDRTDSHSKNLLLWLSSTGVIRVVLSVSYLLVSYFVVNFLRRFCSVCHSFRSMCQSGRMKGFERCFKVEDQCNILRPPVNLSERHFEPFGGRKIPPGIKWAPFGERKACYGKYWALFGDNKARWGIK